MTAAPTPIAILGAGGHAKVVADLVERAPDLYLFGFYDDRAEALPPEVFGVPVRGTRAQLLDDARAGFVKAAVVGIGSNDARVAVASWCEEHGVARVAVVHPSAQLSRGVVIGRGTVVMAGAVINADSVVGDDVIVNTRASVDHDAAIGHGAHIAPGATLCGTVTVGEGAFVCAGATVTPNRRIGAGATVGAGSTVLADVPAGATAVGSPARVVSR